MLFLLACHADFADDADLRMSKSVRWKLTKKQIKNLRYLRDMPTKRAWIKLHALFCFYI